MKLLFSLRSATRQLAGRFTGREKARKERAERERVRQQRRADLIARRVALTAAKRQSEAEHARRKQEASARVEEERRALEAIAAKAYNDYVHVRDHVRRMRAVSDDHAVALTGAEQQMVNALAHLWDATPETIANLRRSCEPISSVRASDYQAAPSDLLTKLKRELGMLRRQVGRELFVQESRALGGFGFDRHGELYNEDTARFFKVLIALHDGAVLEPCRGTGSRRLVWEIGGGWGGFAYQLKTICPNVTYLITGIPDVFLVSAVYLMAVFPGARCRFFSESSHADLWQDWDQVDFNFVPESALPTLLPPQLDLTVDIMALGNMSAERVRSHVQCAFDLGCRYFYSLLPPACSADRPTVSGMIERLYWPHPVPARREQWAPAVMGVEPEPATDTENAHLVGWRRIRV